jgi:hypothetical protein
LVFGFVFFFFFPFFSVFFFVESLSNLCRIFVESLSNLFSILFSILPGKLRRSMSLLEINKMDVEHASFKHIVSLLSDKQQWQGEGLETRWKVAPSRNLKADGKERRVPHHEEKQEQQEKATTPQQPVSRGRQRTRMDPKRNAKVRFEVVWKTGTEKSLGIELIPRKGSGMVGQKDVVRTELQEGALLNAVVTTSYIRDPTYVSGGQHLRKGCRLMSVNGDPVARLPFRQVLEHLLVNQRPLVTTWKLYVTTPLLHMYCYV